MNYRLGSRVIPTSMRGVLVLLMLVVLLPLLVVEAGIGAVWYHSRWSEQTTATLDTAVETANTFEGYVRDVRRQESAMGAALSDLHPYTTDRNRFLTDSGRDYSTIHSWSWANPEGTVVASSDPKAIGLKIGDRAYFQELRGGRPWTLSNLLTDRITGVSDFHYRQSRRRPEGLSGWSCRRRGRRG